MRRIDLSRPIHFVFDRAVLLGLVLGCLNDLAGLAKTLGGRTHTSSHAVVSAISTIRVRGTSANPIRLSPAARFLPALHSTRPLPPLGILPLLLDHRVRDRHPFRRGVVLAKNVRGVLVVKMMPGRFKISRCANRPLCQMLAAVWTSFDGPLATAGRGPVWRRDHGTQSARQREHHNHSSSHR